MNFNTALSVMYARLSKMVQVISKFYVDCGTEDQIEMSWAVIQWRVDVYNLIDSHMTQKH